MQSYFYFKKQFDYLSTETHVRQTTEKCWKEMTANKTYLPQHIKPLRTVDILSVCVTGSADHFL